jgi:DnaJ-class molecular chaperone
MPRELYQDRHPEVDCAECGGAGFFGNGPNVEPCGYCGGKGVVIDDSVMLSPRKPIRRATTSDETITDTRYLGGER